MIGGLILAAGNRKLVIACIHGDGFNVGGHCVVLNGFISIWGYLRGIYHNRNSLKPLGVK